MKKISFSLREPRYGKGPSGDWSQVANVTDLIRNAERHIASRRYSFALEQLIAAQQLEPRNSYIQAIIYRIQGLQNGTAKENGRLEVTVGSEFQSGIKSEDEEYSALPHEIQNRVRRLTSLANDYLEKGSSEYAFEALMKAYLLDPTSPYVLACEKSVLPIWERAHAAAPQSQSNDGFISLSINTERTTVSTPKSGPNPTKGSGIAGPSQPQFAQSQEQRLEMLKQQKELERRERERALWQEASKPPRVFGEDEFQNPGSEPNHESSKQITGLFSKLKRGKFLG